MKTNHVIKEPYFIAVEGDSEQSFIALLNTIFSQEKWHIHLDAHNLGGRSYYNMLETAKERYKKLSYKSYNKKPIFLVDSDRAVRRDENWTIKKLENEVSKAGFRLILQQPKFEAVLLRIISNKPHSDIEAGKTENELKKYWSDYEKNYDKNKLSKNIKIEQLKNGYIHDNAIRQLLDYIGLKEKFRI